MASNTDEYAKFEEKVKRTIYLDNLSPLVTGDVINSAFEQYGDVKSVCIIPNYTEPHCTSKSALVEMENIKQAKNILEMLSTYPFMMLGMPRPIRGLPAEPRMFEDRPKRPGRTIQVRWLESDDPDFAVAQEMKKLAERHVAEQYFLQKKLLDEEEQLSTKQNEALKAHHQKFELLDGIYCDGTSRLLAERYGINMAAND